MYSVSVDENPFKRINLRTEDDNEPFFIELEFSNNCYCWFMNVSYKEKSYNGIRVGLSLNLLRQWQNILPFGIGVSSNSGQDIMRIDDFSSGRATMVVITREELKEFEKEFFTK